MWELTDRAYKRAAPAYLNVKTNNAVQAEEEDKSPDFSKEAPQVHVDEKVDASRRSTAARGKTKCGGCPGHSGNIAEVYYSTVVLQVSSVEFANGNERRNGVGDAQRIGAAGDGSADASG